MAGYPRLPICFTPTASTFLFFRAKGVERLQAQPKRKLRSRGGTRWAIRRQSRLCGRQPNNFDGAASMVGDRIGHAAQQEALQTFAPV